MLHISYWGSPFQPLWCSCLRVYLSSLFTPFHLLVASQVLSAISSLSLVIVFVLFRSSMGASTLTAWVLLCWSSLFVWLRSTLNSNAILLSHSTVCLSWLSSAETPTWVETERTPVLWFCVWTSDWAPVMENSSSNGVTIGLILRRFCLTVGQMYEIGVSASLVFIWVSVSLNQKIYRFLGGSSAQQVN